MFSFGLDGQAFGRVRFCISPLWTVARVLAHARRSSARGYGAACRETLRDGGLPLLASLYLGEPGYIPDFFSPHPEAYEAELTAELHQVASTPVDRIRAEFAVMTCGRPGAVIPARRLPTSVARVLDRGEDTLREEVAAELEQFWRLCLSARWARMRAAMDADIARRAQQSAQQGVASMLGDLHPTMSLADDRLTVMSPYHARVQAPDGVVLMPSPVGTRMDVVLDPTPLPGRYRPVLLYPASTADRGPRTSHRGSGEILGASRALLLADLAQPRSTTELARRHDFTPSTVSYHLGVLARAGLVTRFRRQRHVLYQRTHRAEPLLAAAIAAASGRADA